MNIETHDDQKVGPDRAPAFARRFWPLVALGLVGIASLPLVMLPTLRLLIRDGHAPGMSLPTLAALTLIQPTLVSADPPSAQPLARPHRDKPRLIEAWDLVIDGKETGTAFSELIDPVIQRERLTQQSLAAAAGDPEAMQLDEDFLRALEYGAPPMGGIGLGVDRLVMLFTGVGIREAILFPLMKPE